MALTANKSYLCGDYTYLSLGDNVEYSSTALTNLRVRQRTGKVVGISRDESCMYVMWTGTKKRASYHRSFLKRSWLVT